LVKLRQGIEPETSSKIDRKGILRAVGLHPERVEAVVQKLLAEPAS
jgi:hypothetical protein